MVALALAGCAGDEAAPEEIAPPATVTVPSSDASPPTATITLEDSDGEELGTASQPPGDEATTTVRLDEPRLRATTTGRDPNGGVARVRISIEQRVTCGDRPPRPRIRYYPPPQVERIRSNPGARLPTTKRRTRLIELTDGCDTTGEVWGEAINGSGLEAVTPHVRFNHAK